MREIKFRAWGRLTKDMHNLGPTENFTTEGELEPNEHKVYMQYTGLKDKNGKEIYEGDVLSGKFKKVNRKMVESPSVVFWMESHAMFQHKWDEWNGFHNQPFWTNEPLWGAACSMSKTKVEVIGNIYENPELIKQV